MNGRHGILRARGGGHHRVTYAELFFDLVFVFAITQLSHTLLNHLSPLGALQAWLLFLAVWWAWIDTSWVTNWIDPDRTPVRLLLLALMLAGLVFSASLPRAFGDGALVFAGAYVTIQCGRPAAVVWLLSGENTRLRRNFQRMLFWNIVTGALWIAGALSGEGTRLGLWALALAVENFVPFVGFWAPGLGRSITSEWTVEGGHLAERCGLFVIIALGESVLVTGATFADVPWDAGIVAAFLQAFVGSVAMWWIYFDTGAERGTERLLASSDPGKLARITYTYIHQLIIMGVIVCAVADELALAHPGEPVGLASGAVAIGGPMLYVLGNGLFKRPLLNRFPLSHLIGLGLLALLIPLAPYLSVLALASGATAALVAVALWEKFALRNLHPA